MPGMEYFKSNLTTIEGNLANESLEVTKHAIMYDSWFKWVETSSESTADHMDYLHLQSMPRVVRSLLKRTFREKKDVESVHETLTYFLHIAIDKIHKLELASLLSVFFDPKHPFYVRHGFPDPRISPVNKRKFESQSPPKRIAAWKLELEEGSCVDVQHPVRGWELAVVEHANHATSEIKVLLPDDTVEFLKLDSNRVAKYGTKTGLFGTDEESINGCNEEDLSETNCSSNNEPMLVDQDGVQQSDKLSHVAIESSRTSQWRAGLRRGSLVDVKTKNGSWQQACVCELREVTLLQVACLDEATKVTSSDFEEKLPEIMQIEPDISINHAAVSGNSIVAMYARVAFIGLSESSDEWVDLFDTTTVQPLDSMSGGKRGDGVVRDEIIYIVSIADRDANKDLSTPALHMFYSPYYLEMIMIFLREQGYYRVIEYIKHSIHSVDGSQSVSLTVALHLIVSLGQCSPFVNQSTVRLLNIELSTVISLCIMRLSKMSPQEIRETSTDLLDLALNAVEDLVHVQFGRSEQGGRVVEEALILPISKKYLLSSYLNRRLWGLKRLTDIAQRCLARIDCPDGFMAIRTNSGYTNDGVKNSESLNPVKALKSEIVCYRVVKVTHNITPESLCDFLLRDELVANFFVGDSAHASLMQRAGDLLRFLAIYGKLSSSLLIQIWEVGFVLHESAALQVLTDVVQDLLMPSLQLLLNTIFSIATKAVTVTLVDIIVAIAQRSLLCNSSGEGISIMKSVHLGCSIQNSDQFDDLFVRSLILLWNWSSDSSDVTEICKAKALLKLESFIGIKESVASDVNHFASFDWNRHWSRTIIIIKLALKDLSANTTIVAALRVLRAAIIAWPEVYDITLSLRPPMANKLPFDYPARAFAAEYLQNNIDVLQLLCDVVVCLKSKFSDAIKNIDEFSTWHSKSNESFLLSSEMESILNQTIIGSSRYGYTDTLEECFKFMIFFAHCSLTGKINITYSIVENIFGSILTMAVTLREKNVVVSFLSQLLDVRCISPEMCRQVGIGHGEISATKSHIEPIISHRIMQFDDVENVFKLLLCDKKFIESKQLSRNGFHCIVVFFRWINAEKGGLVNDPDKFILCKGLPMLQGWEVFLQIMLCCPSMTVAMEAIKFLTSLVNKFSIPLIESGEIGSHYRMLVDLSISMLNRLKYEYEVSRATDSDKLASIDDISVVINEVKSSTVELIGMQILEQTLACGYFCEKVGDEADWVIVNDSSAAEKRCTLVLQRVLILLTAVLDENSTDAGKHNIQSHDSRSRNEPVEFKISCVGKKKFLEISFIKLLLTDRLGDLLLKIEKNLSPPYTMKNLRIFNRGKELNIPSAMSANKRFKDLHFCSIETLTIAERPNAPVSVAPSADLADSTTAPDSEVQKGFDANYALPIDLLPIIVLSRNEHYFDLLFSMLQFTTGELTSALWALISRLPTSETYLQRWKNLTGTDFIVENGILDLLGVRAPKSAMIDRECYVSTIINIPRLVYSLQIIENIIDSSTSRISDASHIDVEWIQSFVDKGGLCALVLALMHSSQSLNFFLNTASSKNASASSGVMLLQSLSGLTKLIRFLFILLCISIEIDLSSLAPLLLKSHERMQTLAGKSGDVEAEYASQRGHGKTDNLSANCNTSDVGGVSNVISNEWGHEYLTTVRIARPDRELLVKTQLTLLSCFQYLRIFSESYPSIMPLASKKSATTTVKMTLEESHISTSVENLVTIWGCLFCIDSTLTAEASDENVLGPFLTASCWRGKAVFTIDQFPSRLTAWFMIGFVDILELVRQSGPANFKRLCTGALAVALSLRPSLVSCDEISLSTQHPLPEITLICKIMDLSEFDDGPAISEADRSTLGCNIFFELKDCAGIKKDGVSTFVNGSLQLLCTLCRGREGVLQVLYQAGIVSFLLKSALGLEEMEQLNLGSLCMDDCGKVLSYSLLLIIATWRQEVAEEISDKMRKVHANAIQALKLNEESNSSKSAKADITSSISKGIMKGTFKPERDVRSSIGYCGIRNMGCTCYMNSLLQVLYMIPEVRRGVLNFPVNFSEMTNEAKADNLVLQLQRMFIFLSSSQRKAYNPESWAFAYKDETGVSPINVAQQQDAQEFLQVLCERLESQYFVPTTELCKKDPMGVIIEGESEEPNNLDSGGVKFNVMQKSFGGKLSNQMIRTNGNELDIREKEESFVCISLDVVGTAGLESSLNKFVTGETITDFQWEENKPRESIVKRQCLDELSNTVIFHLKRFELNFDTFQREKVNDAFPFPTFLNLFPYSKEGLTVKSSSIAAADCRPSSYYQYELQGIVEHTGTTDSGHYFSYVRETDSFDSASQNVSNRKRWIEFNDSEVSEFSESLIPSECFGGKGTTQSKSTNPKNAYMLIYRRIHPIEENNNVDVAAVAEEILGSPIEFQRNVQIEVAEDNRRHILCSRVFTNSHFNFMMGLFDVLRSYGSLNRSTWIKEGEYVGKEATILEDFITFSLKIVARTSESALYYQLLIRIIESVTETLPEVDIYGPLPIDILNKENVPGLNSTMDISGDDEAAALALSLNLQRESSTAVVAAPGTHIYVRDESVGDSTLPLPQHSNSFKTVGSLVNAALDIVNIILTDFDGFCSLMFHTDMTTRMVTARMFFTFYSILNCGGNSLAANVIDSIPQVLWKLGVISSTQVAVHADMEVEDGEAIDFSAAATTAALGSFLANNSSPGIMCIKVLFELTKDELLQAISEHWRRSDAVSWLIHSLSNSNWQTRHIMARREIVLGICDIFLGDQSLTGGGLFVQGSRRRAPSSYENVPHVKPGTINHHAKNIPDWTMLLDTLASVVTASVDPSSPYFGRAFNPFLDSLSLKSIQSKVLFNTALKQDRYCPALCKLMYFNCFENHIISNDFAETIRETLSVCSSDSVYHIFNVMSKFLLISDHLAVSRVAMIFSGANSILEMAKNCQDSRAAFVSVFIKSVVELSNANINVYNNLSSSSARIEFWAKWMLKFSYQYQGKVQLEANSLAALKGNSETNDLSVVDRQSIKEESKYSAAKGPYFPVYGESESTFEMPTSERAELCFQSLRNMILRMGGNPDVLIPDDAFIELPLDDAAIGAAFDLTNDIPIDIDCLPHMVDGDHMTDEEFARFLASHK